MKWCTWFHSRLAYYNEEKPRDRGPHIRRQTSQCDPQPSKVFRTPNRKIWTLKKARDRYGTPTIWTHLVCRSVWKLSYNEVKIAYSTTTTHIWLFQHFRLASSGISFLNYNFQTNLCRFYLNLNRGLNCIFGSKN